MAESRRQRLSDPHQPNSAGGNGEPAPAPVPFNQTKEKYAITRRIEAILNSPAGQKEKRST
jgi:hypothetical protein